MLVLCCPQNGRSSTAPRVSILNLPCPAWAHGTDGVRSALGLRRTAERPARRATQTIPRAATNVDEGPVRQRSLLPAEALTLPLRIKDEEVNSGVSYCGEQVAGRTPGTGAERAIDPHDGADATGGGVPDSYRLVATDGGENPAAT